MKKVISAALCLALLLICVLPASAETQQAGFHKSLRAWITDKASRVYVERMLDYHVRTNQAVIDALDDGYCAVFLFDGCSDNMDDPVLSDLSYYRVSAVCVVLRRDGDGQLKLAYINSNASTLPDRPLEYGAWTLPKIGDVGPATILDGTYQLYSVFHKGEYEALHMRSAYDDGTIPAIYMTPEGYTAHPADSINIHTRTSNHTSGSKYMWSAGCPLIGGGSAWEFWKLLQATYYDSYDNYNGFAPDRFVGTITIDRQALRTEMYTLYKNPDAVDAMLANTHSSRLDSYLALCGKQEHYSEGKLVQVQRQTQLMSMPCSGQTDEWSKELAVLEPGQTLRVYGSLFNTRGNLWYEASREGQRCFLYAGHVKLLEPEPVRSWWQRLLGIGD